MKAISNPTANDSSKSENRPLNDNLEKRLKRRKSYISRRSFLGKSLAVGAGTIGGAGLLTSIRTAEASGGLTLGDAALLRFQRRWKQSRPTFGSNTTNSAASRTPKSQA